MKYFVKMFDKTFGPFDEQKILQMYQNNKIKDSTEISRDKVEWSDLVNVLPYMTFQSSEVTTNEPVNSAESNAPINGEQTSVPPPLPVTQGDLNTQQPEPAIWHYSNDGQTGFGPVTRTHIGELLLEGRLNRKTLVWRQGEGSRYLENEVQLADLLSYSSVNPMDASMFSSQSWTPTVPDTSRNAEIALQKLLNSEPVQDTTVTSPPQTSRCLGLESLFSSQQSRQNIHERYTSTGYVSSEKSDVSRSTYILLALFLGCFGVHNFYAKRTVIGLYELLAGMTSVMILFLVFLATLLTGTSGGFWLTIPFLIYIGEFIGILFEICSVTNDGDGRKMN